MKKIVSFLAVAAVLGGSIMGTVGCSFGGGGGKEVKALKGTTGAKIALARERLDESVFSEEMNFWGAESTVGVKTEGTAPSGMVRAAVKRAKSDPNKGVTVQGGKVRWSQFGNNFGTMENFENVFNEIEIKASQVAESIGIIKKYVGVTDKWVGDNQLLLVEENRETLVQNYVFEDPSSMGYQVAHRYTREDAKNIYDIYSYTSERGEIGQNRMKYIPGEYYESSYVHSSGFTDYFMAEKSSGYWKLSRFGNVRESGDGKSIYVANYVIKDGVGIGILYDSGAMNDGHTYESIHYDFFDTTTGQDLFRAVEEGENRYNVSTYLGNIASGLAYVEANESDVRFDGDIVMNQLGWAGRLVFNGDKPGQDTEDIKVNGVDVGYDYGNERYHGITDMAVTADSLLDAIQKIDNYWVSNGVTLKTKLSSMNESVSYVQTLAQSFEDTFLWNGYKAATLDGIAQGQAALETFFAEGTATYNKVKNYEKIEYKREEVAKVSFAAVDVMDTSQSTYENGKITLNNASLTISDTTLLEEGSEYVLKLGLALKNNNGLQSVNMVTLDTASETKVAFAEGGTTLTVTQSGEYEIPANLAEGNYAVVAYVATADEGIRVSNLQEVAFGTVTAGEVPSTAMKVDVKKAGNALAVHYGVKLSVQADIKTQASYTAKDVEKALTRAVLMYGYPKTGEVVTTEDGEPLASDSVIVSGTYKVKFFIHTEDGMAEAYAYVTIA